jgi:outer membrane protein assembly factor BamD
MLVLRLPAFPSAFPHLLACFALGVALVSGCGGSAASSLNYGDNARFAYAEALDDFYDDDCLEAAPAFANVRREYPYTRFAALAELRAADCMFNDGKYVESAQAYELFIRYRPSHVEVPYARFMVARSHYEQIPSEWLLSPPTHEREQRFTQESLSLLRRFILDYPNDVLVPRAQRMAARAVKLLAAHELYVADFYRDRDHPMAALGRLRTLMTTYPSSGYEAEALYLLGETYLDLDQKDEAKKAFSELVSRFPKSDEASSARERLGSLGS